MAESTQPVSKKKKYLVKFKDSWIEKFNFIRKSFKGENFASCSVCRCDFNIGHGGENDILIYEIISENISKLRCLARIMFPGTKSTQFLM
jgi:hypothetical protein